MSATHFSVGVAALKLRARVAGPRKYPDELRERAVRLVFESKRPIAHVALDLG
jgi:transposase-like protein